MPRCFCHMNGRITFHFVEQVTSLAGACEGAVVISLVSFEQRDGCRQVMEWRGGIDSWAWGGWGLREWHGVWVLTLSRGRVGGCARHRAGLCLFSWLPSSAFYSLGGDPQVRERNNSRNGINSGQRRGLLLSAGHMQKSAEGWPMVFLI